MEPEDKAIGLVQSVRYAFCARNQPFIKSNKKHSIFSALFDVFFTFSGLWATRITGKLIH